MKDYLGKRFSMLTVTGYAGKEDGQHLWRCKCDCGKETVVRQRSLQSGKTKSCGCLQEKQLLENLKLCEGTSVTILEAGRRRLRPTKHQRHNRRLPEQAHRKMVRTRLRSNEKRTISVCMKRKTMPSGRENAARGKEALSRGTTRTIDRRKAIVV
ncbi:MAG: hypothetical protein V8T46_02840 [Sutterella seckii]